MKKMYANAKIKTLPKRNKNKYITECLLEIRLKT
jgi:hypothetical protein